MPNTITADYKTTQPAVPMRLRAKNGSPITPSSSTATGPDIDGRTPKTDVFTGVPAAAYVAGELQLYPLGSPSEAVYNTDLVTVVAGAPTTGFNVVTCGNSNVFGGGGASAYPAQMVAMLGTDYPITNWGHNAWDLPTLLSNFAAQEATSVVAGKRNILVMMEGTNTLKDPAIRDNYVDLVKEYFQKGKDAGYSDFFYISTLPMTAVPGVMGDVNAYSRIVDPQLQIDLPPLGIRYIDLRGGLTLIGALGTAANGNDAGYSSYLPTVNGQLSGTNPYFTDADGSLYRVHLSDRGYNILARVVADHILNLTTGLSMPDRSHYNEASAPVPDTPMSWKNLAGTATLSADRTTLGTTGGSFSGSGNSDLSLGATANDYKGQLATNVAGASMFIGLNDAPSGVGFDDMKVGLFFNAAQQAAAVSQWASGAPGADIGLFPDTAVPVVFKVYAARVEAYINGATTASATWNVVMNYPCWLDTSLSVTANKVNGATIVAPNPVATP